MENELTKERRDACAKVFAVIDAAGHGKLPRGCMMQALRLLNYNPTEEQLQTWLRTQENLEYNFEEFVAFVTKVSNNSIHLQEDRKLDLREAFAVFDKTNSGYIDSRQFLDILTKYGNMKVEEADAVSWLEHLDRRKDGRIRIAELEELFISDDDVNTVLNGQSWDQV